MRKRLTRVNNCGIICKVIVYRLNMIRSAPMIKNKEMLFINFPPIGKITPKVKEENSKRVFTGGVRIGNSMYRTDEETKKYKERSLQRKLP